MNQNVLVTLKMLWFSVICYCLILPSGKILQEDGLAIKDNVNLLDQVWKREDTLRSDLEDIKIKFNKKRPGSRESIVLEDEIKSQIKYISFARNDQGYTQWMIIKQSCSWIVLLLITLIECFSLQRKWCNAKYKTWPLLLLLLIYTGIFSRLYWKFWLESDKAMLFSFQGAEEDVHTKIHAKKQKAEVVQIAEVIQKLKWLVLYHWIFWIYLSLTKPKAKKEFDPDMLFHYCTRGQNADKEELRQIFEEHWHDIDVNDTQDGNTIFHLAIENNHLSIVQLLFKTFGEKIDMGICNADGINALNLAIKGKKMEMFNLVLVYSKADLSSMILAVELEQVKMIKSLISNVPRKDIGNVIEFVTSFCNVIEELNKRGLSKIEKQELTEDANTMKVMITNALKRIKDNIESVGEIEATEEPLVTDEDLISRAEKVKKELQCKNCSKVMMRPLRIYACSNDCYICSMCLGLGLDRCPICSENFKEKPASKRPTAERLLATLLGQDP